MSQRIPNYVPTKGGIQEKIKNEVKPATMALDELRYRPTDKERVAKARLLRAVQAQPFLDLQKLTTVEIEALVGMGIRKYVAKEGFDAWLRNMDDQRDRLEVLFDKALDAAEQILDNADPKAQSARVQMVRFISELANKMPDRFKPQSAIRDTLQSLDKAEIEALFEQQGITMNLSLKKGNSPINVTHTVEDIDGTDKS